VLTRILRQLVAGTAVFFLAGAASAAPASSADPGEAVFKQACASCHTVGGGDTVGPDLKGLTAAAGGVELVRAFMTDPAAKIASGDPTIDALVKKFNGLAMPKPALSPDQVDQVVAYLQSQDGGGSTEAPADPVVSPAPQVAAGDAAAGKRLFSGAARLAERGPACMSCHTIAGAGALGGGNVGPDLTGAYDKYGGAKGMASVLTTLPFPKMIALYKDHPLAAAEQADLAAYFATTVGKQRPPDRSWVLVVIGIGGTVGFLGLAFLIWPKRRLVVRKRLVSSPTAMRRN